MPTLREQLDRLTTLKHQLAIWQYVHENLDNNFVSKDEGRAEVKALRVENCLTEIVPEETIEDVLQAIGTGFITKLQAQIAAIENQQVILGEAESK